MVKIYRVSSCSVTDDDNIFYPLKLELQQSDFPHNNFKWAGMAYIPMDYRVQGFCNPKELKMQWREKT